MLRRFRESLPGGAGFLGMSGDARTSHFSRASLKSRISLLTASMVAIAVGMMLIVSYWSVSGTLRSSMDRALNAKATALISRMDQPDFFFRSQYEIDKFREYNVDTRISLRMPGWNYSVGDDLPMVKGGGDDVEGYSAATINGERVLTKVSDSGATVILARGMEATHKMITSLAITLLLVAGLGVLMAIATGVAVASTVLRPLRRLRNRVRYITETDDLKPIQVEGNDELSELTTRFNEMLEALRRSRQRQTELVADAGHELKTPLTSMRTNIELLMMMHNTDSASISEEDKQALQSDVIAQMEELSTLIGDLIDLARQETSEKTLEPIDLLDVVNSSVERVRRRRPDVRFEIQAIPWYLEGDSFALGRAILNLLDNASKWSPADGVVRFTMQVVECEDGDRVLHMDISDSGPGIPVEDREKVFDRFYRSVSARSTPGSGLGLAIVHSTIVRHGGTVTAGESDDGGARMRVELPGSVTDEELHSSSKTRVVQPSSTAERLDLARQRREERRNGK